VSWDSEVLQRVCARWKVGDTFRQDEVYFMESELSSRFPRNTHVKDKIRQVLQHLRDQGYLRFVDDRGTYLRLR
jgi:type II restriction enzyme